MFKKSNCSIQNPYNTFFTTRLSHWNGSSQPSVENHTRNASCSHRSDLSSAATFHLFSSSHILNVHHGWYAKPVSMVPCRILIGASTFTSQLFFFFWFSGSYVQIKNAYKMHQIWMEMHLILQKCQFAPFWSPIMVSKNIQYYSTVQNDSILLPHLIDYWPKAHKANATN